MSQTILIAGGSGLVGTELKNLLEAQQYKVTLLSTQKSLCDGEQIFHWNPAQQEIDHKAIATADYIVNLAGENVVGSWSKDKKKRIIDSRTQSVRLINQTLEQMPNKVKAICSASATGIYGNNGAEIVSEDSPAKEDFLSQTCVAWEKAQEEQKNIRQTTLRIGVVLSEKGGALAKMLPGFRMGLGLALGTGEQYMPWIHIDDLCRMILFVLENENCKSTYNAVAPNPITNKDFSGLLNRQVKKVFFMLKVPSFLLRIIMGESADILLFSQRASAQKIINEGFNFHYEKAKPALKQLVPL